MANMKINDTEMGDFIVSKSSTSDKRWNITKYNNGIVELVLDNNGNPWEVNATGLKAMMGGYFITQNLWLPIRLVKYYGCQCDIRTGTGYGFGNINWLENSTTQTKLSMFCIGSTNSTTMYIRSLIVRGTWK